MTEEIAPTPERMRVVESLDSAIRRTRQILFTPFEFKVWLQFGVIIFLSMLAQLKLSFSFRVPGSFRRGWGEMAEFDPAEAFRDVDRWVHDHLPMIFVLGSVVLVLLLALGLLILWVGCRGQLMLVRAVARRRSGIGENWFDTRTPANSLFKFKVAMYVLAMAIFLAIAVPAYYVCRDVVPTELSALGPLLIRLMPLLILAIIASLTFALIEVLLRSFIVPIMYRQNQSCLVAWRTFAHVFHDNYLPILGFLGLRLAYTFGFAFVALFACCFTCTVGAWPVIHQTLFAPYYVFDRAFPMYMLESLGPQHCLFDPMPSEGTTEPPQFRSQFGTINPA
ncbi:MAG: hypothetical protein HY706_02430 [Candidatus Hydrogenedentes bacterium]|nr:hypothetical protein [Candidatus Hydrogenedentota bacterium]